MAGDDRTALNMDFDDLSDFEPKVAPRRQETVKRSVDSVSGFPSREASEDGQLNMKGRKAVLDRFKGMCKDDRRSYVDMLEILMDRFEKG
ncbi:MAG: hypothetical protein AAF583_11865 [Pseudomonadota bacterium]